MGDDILLEEYVSEVVQKRDGNDTVKFIQPIVATWNEQESTKNRHQKKFLVVSKFRVFFFSKSKIPTLSKTKLALERDFHLFEIKHISGEMRRELMITFCSFLNPGAGNTVLYMLSEDNHAIVLAIGQSYRMFTLGWSERVRFDVNVDEIPRNFSLSFPEEIRDPGAHNFLAVYQATSNLTNSPPSTPLVHYIADLMNSKNKHHLNLTNIPGIDGKGELAIHFVALCCALQNNTFIRSFEVRGVPLRDAGEGLALMLRHNRTLTSVILADTGAECTESFGNALIQNPWNRVQVLDISSLKFSPNGALFFTKGLQYFNHALSVLNIENCLGNNPKGTLSLFLALQGNPGMSLCLKEFNVSQNKMDAEGSEECIRWLNSACTAGSLRRLSLANTGVIVGHMMKESILKKLRYLDVSDNKFDKQHTSNFGVFSTATKLKQLRISGCSIPSEGVRTLFQVLSDNKHVSDLAIDLSNNDLGSKGALLIYDVLDKCNKIIELDLAENNFKTDGGRLILSAIPASVTKLNVSGNFHPHGLELEEFHVALGTLLGKRPNLTSLNLSGRKERRLGKGIAPFFKYLKTNQTLRDLDLSNNNMGDAAFALLCRALKDNIAITSLNFDQNSITQNGLLALKYMLQSNKILSRLEYPYFDLPKDEHSHAILADILKLINSRKSFPPPPNLFKFVSNWPIKTGPPQPLFSDIPEDIAARAHLIFGPPSDTLTFKDMDTDRIELTDTSEDKNSKMEYVRPLTISERSKSTPHGRRSENQGKIEKKYSEDGKMDIKKYSEDGKMEKSNSDPIYEQRDFLTGIEEVEERKLYNLSKVKSVKETMKAVTTGQWSLSNLSPRLEVETSYKPTPEKKIDTHREIPKIDVTFKSTPPRKRTSETEKEEKSSKISSSEENPKKEKSTEEKPKKEKSSEEIPKKETSKEGKDIPSKRYSKPMVSPRRPSKIHTLVVEDQEPSSPSMSPRKLKISEDLKKPKRKSARDGNKISEIPDSPGHRSAESVRKNSGARASVGPGKKKNTNLKREQQPGMGGKMISEEKLKNGKKKSKPRPLSAHGLNLTEMPSSEPYHPNGAQTERLRHTLDLDSESSKSSKKEKIPKSHESEDELSVQMLSVSAGLPAKLGPKGGPRRRRTVDERRGSHTPLIIATPHLEIPVLEVDQEEEPVTKTEPTKTEPTKTEPTKTEPTKTEPTKTEPTKTEPTRKIKSPRRRTTVSVATKYNGNLEKLPEMKSSNDDKISHAKTVPVGMFCLTVPGQTVSPVGPPGTPGTPGTPSTPGTPVHKLSTVSNPETNKFSKDTLIPLPTTYSAPLIIDEVVSRDSKERAVPKRLPMTIKHPSEGSPRREKRPLHNVEFDIANEIEELENFLEAEELSSPKPSIVSPRKFITKRVIHSENEQEISHQNLDGGSLK